MSTPVTKEISDWLENLGMSEYAERFAENGIDVSVLRYLTDQDLEKIGVLLGHRRKILAAINELVGTERAVPKPVAVVEAKPALLLFCATHRQCPLSGHCSVGTCCWVSARRYPASEARQT